jgi:hypothetical protein
MWWQLERGVRKVDRGWQILSHLMLSTSLFWPHTWWVRDPGRMNPRDGGCGSEFHLIFSSLFTSATHTLTGQPLLGSPSYFTVIPPLSEMASPVLSHNLVGSEWLWAMSNQLLLPRVKICHQLRDSPVEGIDSKTLVEVRWPWLGCSSIIFSIHLLFTHSSSQQIYTKLSIT